MSYGHTGHNMLLPFTTYTNGKAVRRVDVPSN